MAKLSRREFIAIAELPFLVALLAWALLSFVMAGRVDVAPSSVSVWMLTIGHLALSGFALWVVCYAIRLWFFAAQTKSMWRRTLRDISDLRRHISEAATSANSISQTLADSIKQSVEGTNALLAESNMGLREAARSRKLYHRARSLHRSFTEHRDTLSRADFEKVAPAEEAARRVINHYTDFVEDRTWGIIWRLGALGFLFVASLAPTLGNLYAANPEGFAPTIMNTQLDAWWHSLAIVSLGEWPTWTDPLAMFLATLARAYGLLYVLLALALGVNLAATRIAE